MGLKCTVPGCRKTIHAFTGLDEVRKLQKHLKSAHKYHADMNEVLDIRARMEDGVTFYTFFSNPILQR